MAASTYDFNVIFNNKFDLKELQDLLTSDETTNLSNAYNKDIVLIIGNTGAGKTTLANYLAGNPLKIEHKDGVDRLETETKSWLKIGHGDDSCTTVPTVSKIKFNKVKKDLYCCDTPGFIDTRDPTTKVAVSMLTESVIKKSKNIKGVIIVIDYMELRASRGASIKNLIETLFGLFDNPIEIIKNSLIMLTKTPVGFTTDSLYNFLQKKIVDINNSLENPKLSTKIKEDKAIAKEFYQGLLKKYTKQTVKIFMGRSTQVSTTSIHLLPIECVAENSLEVRVKILNSILDLKPLKKSDLNFSQYYKEREIFDRHIKYAVRQANSLYLQKTRNINKKYGLIEQIKYAEGVVATLKNRIAKLAVSKDTTSTDEVKEITESVLRRHRTRLNKLKNNQGRLTTAIENHNKTIAAIETNDQEEKFAFEKKWGFFKCDEDIKFDFSNRPYTRVEKDHYNGVFSAERENKKNGKYSIHFKGGLFSSASITVYGKTRHNDHNTSKLKKTIELLSQAEEDLVKSKREIVEVNKKIATAEKLQKNSHSMAELITQLEIQKKVELDKIQLLRENITKIDSLIENIKHKINNNFKVFEFIDSIRDYYWGSVFELEEFSQYIAEDKFEDVDTESCLDTSVHEEINSDEESQLLDLLALAQKQPDDEVINKLNEFAEVISNDILKIEHELRNRQYELQRIQEALLACTDNDNSRKLEAAKQEIMFEDKPAAAAITFSYEQDGSKQQKQTIVFDELITEESHKLSY